MRKKRERERKREEERKGKRIHVLNVYKNSRSGRCNDKRVALHTKSSGLEIVFLLVRSQSKNTKMEKMWCPVRLARAI